jgi:CheY-like chemotaxis protein
MQRARTPVLERADAPPPEPAPFLPRSPVGAPASLGGVRVLVVEDDGDTRDLICRVLEMAGATMLCVESVAKAMDGVYQSFDPDVVLTDFSMPGADGLELIREFRMAPSTRAVAVPILVLSGHSESGWRTRALAAGAAAVLTKPFVAARLIAELVAAVAPGRA